MRHINRDHQGRVTDYTAICILGNVVDRHCVCAPAARQNADRAGTYQKVTGPLMANSHPGGYSGQDAYTDMLIAEKDCADPSDVRYIVRRFTPMECERLQGFPDGWTKWMAGGTVLKDSPRYRMLGNSLAIPTAYHVISRVAKALEGERL